MQVADLHSWHRLSIDDPSELGGIFASLRERKIVLSNGMDHRNRPRTARVVSVRGGTLSLAHENIDVSRQPILVFSFELDGVSYTMAGAPVEGSRSGPLVDIQAPSAVHVVERRGRLRKAQSGSRQARLAKLVLSEFESVDVRVVDRSRSGLGLASRFAGALEAGRDVRVIRNESGADLEARTGTVRHVRFDSGAQEYRIGLSFDAARETELVHVESRRQVLPGGVAARGWSRVSLASQALQRTSRRLRSANESAAASEPEIDVVEFKNQKRQPIRGIVDREHAEPGGIGVVIPPAWGRTKETLLPLARTIVATFARAGHRVTVLRFDGTQRRGESFVDPECRQRGDETLRFTYSQAAADLEAAANFLRGSPRYAVDHVALVTFSLAAIEGRLALARSDADDFAAWIAVVGMTDVQSALRSVSGGIDYVLGKEASVDFGVHELGGVRIDIDHASRDVLENDIATLDEAKRDVARIACPIAWIHGRDDGWTEIERVRELLSVESPASRSIIEVPTGHQLRTSTEALDTFLLVSEQLSKLVIGEMLAPTIPDLADLELRNEAERRRVRGARPDLRGFWQDYLLGKEFGVGMDLLGATPFYAEFMRDQVRHLKLRDGLRVLDLGAGTGGFLRSLESVSGPADNVDIVCADLVRGALERGRGASAHPSRAQAAFCVADFETSLPFADDSFDRVMASLLIAYLSHGSSLVREIRRVLRPKGRLVLSSPRRDADLSSLYRETIATLSASDLAEILGGDFQNFDEVQRNYLNEAARLVEYEEAGHFVFRDPDELERLLVDEGFEVSASYVSLGNPPQASVVAATLKA